jgi:hypothetical protein
MEYIMKLMTKRRLIRAGPLLTDPAGGAGLELGETNRCDVESSLCPVLKQFLSAGVKVIMFVLIFHLLSTGCA